jgi:hypothetical protein
MFGKGGSVVLVAGGGCGPYDGIVNSGLESVRLRRVGGSFDVSLDA